MEAPVERKLIIVGLDGATFDILDPLAASGKIPNIARIMSAGARRTLMSTIHPMTPSAWTSMVTGKNPGKHGVYDFYRRKAGSYRMELVNARVRGAEPMWGALSRHGKRVGIINVPISYPPDPVDGFMVSGMDTPGLKSKFTYPEPLHDELLAAVDGYMIDADEAATDELEYLALTLKMLDKRIEASRFLLAKYADLSLFMVTFVAPDRIQHAFWKYIDPQSAQFSDPIAADFRNGLETAFSKLDTYIGELLEALGPNGAIMLVSDHGFGSLKKDVYLNKFLADLGLLRFKPGAQRLGPDCLETLDWERTKAYAFGYFGNININLKGREPLGNVEPGLEAERLKTLIIDQLEELKDPDTSEPVTDRVWRREELYEGQFLDLAPDILVKMRDYAYMTRADYESVSDALMGEPMKYHRNAVHHTGNHRPEGVFAVYGSGVRGGQALDPADITDIAPTVLHYLGNPVPSDMDGKVLEDIFEESFMDERDIKLEQPQPSYSVQKPAAGEPAAARRLLEEQNFQLRRLSQELSTTREELEEMRRQVKAWQEDLPGLHEYVRHLETEIANRDRHIAYLEKSFSPLAVLSKIAGMLKARVISRSSAIRKHTYTETGKKKR